MKDSVDSKKIKPICDFLYDKIYTFIVIKEIITKKNKKLIKSILDKNPISDSDINAIKSLHEEGVINEIKSLDENEIKNISNDILILKDIDFIKEISKTVDEIKEYIKNKEFVKLNTSIQKLLEIIFKNKEFKTFIDSFIYLFNLSSEHNLSYYEIDNEQIDNEQIDNDNYLSSITSELKKKSKSIIDKIFSLFGKDKFILKNLDLEGIHDIESISLIKKYNFYYNKKIISKMFQKIKSDDNFKQKFVELIKFIINNLLEICVCDKDNNSNYKLKDTIHRIVLLKTENYINELKNIK